MTRAIVRQTLATLAPTLKKHKLFKVAFNVVAADFLSDSFTGELRGLVREAGVATRQVVIELTERHAIEDLDRAARRVAELKEFGFKVAIDDAGTGHNGLSYIHQLGANTIKIDKAFIDFVGHDEAATTIVQMLVRLAKVMGMETVAEGVETIEQVRFLHTCGVDQAQGYLVAPPLAAEEFLGMLGEAVHREDGNREASKTRNNATRAA